MTVGRRPRLYETVPNRGAGTEELAAYLGISRSKFDSLRPRLRAAGFPEPDPLLGVFDLRAVNAWLDKRAGLGGDSDPEDSGLAARIARFGEADRETPAH
jgi:hypothetical protein